MKRGLRCIWGGVLAAWAAGANACIQLDLPAQPLDRALLMLAAQSRLQIAFDPQLLAQTRSAPLSGCLDPRQALQQLIRGAGLQVEWLAERVVVLREPKRDAAPTQSVNQELVEEILVTGSHLQPLGQDGPVGPVTVVQLDGPLGHGRARLGEVMAALPASAGSEFQVHNLQQPFAAGISGINLRNLGLGATLVLIKGRRQTPASVATADGSTLVDLDTLMPQVLVDRVEVLRDGGSAVYGSDAIAGVINVVPKQDVQGVTVSGRYLRGRQARPRDWEISLLAGTDWNETHAQLALSWLDRDPLTSADRDFTAGTAWSDFGRPGTFLDSGGYYHDPACGVAGTRFSSDGRFCQFDISPYYDLSPNEQRGQLFASLAAPQWELELGWAQVDLDLIASPSYPFTLQQPRVPAANPGNPGGEDALFYGRALGTGASPSRSSTRYRVGRIAGAVWQDLDGWLLRSDFSYSRHRSQYGRADAVADRVQAALEGRGGPNGNLWWNPLLNADNPPGLEQWFLEDIDLRTRTDLLTLDAVARHPVTVWSWQGEIALGGQYRHERLRHDYSDAFNAMRFMSLGGGPDFEGRRDIVAAYAELGLVHGDLELNLAGRYESYGSGANGWSPKLALHWQWTPRVALRASASGSFRAASLFQSVASQSVAAPVRDPMFDNVPQFKTVLSRAEQALNPERAVTLTLGTQWQWRPGIRAEATAWWVSDQDMIVKTSAQQLVNAAVSGDEAASVRVRRDPVSGQIRLIEAPFVNAGEVRTRGLDLALNGRWSRLQWEAVATYTDRFRYRETEQGITREGVGHRNAGSAVAASLPRWRALLSARWELTPAWEVGGVLRFSSHYQDEVGNREVSSHTPADFYSRWLRNDWQLTLGVINALDRDPPRVADLLGYDRQLHDPRGRLWYVSTGYNW